MIYEILDDTNTVINTIVAELSFVEENYPGHFRDVTPPAPPPPPASTIITKLALLNRMTDAEFIGILNAAKTDAEVELWKIRFDTATTIDLADGSKVIAGFPMLVSKGLLTQERSTTITTSPIQPNES
jgi:hypothetical protein